MRTSKLISLAAFLGSLILSSGSDVSESLDGSVTRRMGEGDPKPPPHPHPSGSSQSATEGSSASESSSSSSSSMSSSGSGSHGSSVSAATGATVNSVHKVQDGGLHHKGALLALGVAAVVGAALAALARPKRRVETAPDHPLKGSLNKRIELFTHLASDKGSPTVRKGRESDYVNADVLV